MNKKKIIKVMIMAILVLFWGGVLRWHSGKGSAGSTGSEEEVRAAVHQAEALLDQAWPHVQAVLAWQGPRPQLRPLAAEQFYGLPRPDLEVFLSWHFADWPPARRQQAVSALRAVRAQGAIAQAVEGEKDLFFLPGQQEVLARLDEGLAGVKAPAFMQLALVQEAARHILAARYPLAQLRAACRCPEEQQILQALIEGRVSWVCRAVAHRLGIASCFPLLEECLHHLPDPPLDADLRAAVQLAVQQEIQARRVGLAFFTYLEEHGFSEAESRLFRRPPAQWCWLLEPALFLRQQRAGRGDLRDLLAPLLTEAPVAGWRGTTDVWTPAMVREAAALVGAASQAERSLRGWEDGQLVLWLPTEPAPALVALGVIRFQEVAAARAYLTFAADLQRQLEGRGNPPCAGALHILQARVTPVSLAGLEEALRFEETVQAGTNPPQARCLILGRRGDLVLQWTWQGVPPDLTWAQRLLTLLSASPAARPASAQPTATGSPRRTASHSR